MTALIRISASSNLPFSVEPSMETIIGLPSSGSKIIIKLPPAVSVAPVLEAISPGISLVMLFVFLAV